MGKDLEITNENPMAENISIGMLEESIVESLLNGVSIVIPAFGYLEVKSVSDKRVALYKTAGAEHPVMKEFSSGSNEKMVSDISRQISTPLKRGEKVSLSKVGVFHPIKNSDGSFRISFTPASYLRNALNGNLQKLLVDPGESLIKDKPLVEKPEEKTEERPEEKEDIFQAKTAESLSEIFKEVEAISSEPRIEPAEEIFTFPTLSDEVNDFEKPQSEEPVVSTKRKPKDKEKRKERRRLVNWLGIIMIFAAAACAVYFYVRHEEKLHDGVKVEPTNLLNLAEKHYGNKVFWVYIYEANQEKIKSPIDIPLGIDIEIPDLKKLNINTEDSFEIARAKEKGELIINKDKPKVNY